MGCDKRLQLSYCFWWFLNLLVVPENKRKFVVFSFRPVDSIVFLKLKCNYFFYLHVTFFSECWCNRILKCVSFTYQKNIFWPKMHFNFPE